MKRASQLVVGVVLVASASMVIGATGACTSDSPADPATTTGEGGPGGDGDVASTDGPRRAPDGAPILEDGALDPDAPPVDPGKTGASCMGLAATCGGSKDCCASNLVAGGTFNRSNDPAFPATVSDFKLDVYEVTVGRFRTFVNAGKGTQSSPPAPGDGAHPKIASSGWNPAFNASLPATTADLKAGLKCIAAYPAWTDAPSGHETNPLNCVTWFEAFAFCAWDGGRLPTEAEWNYAAAGGNEQREYPWGAGIDLTKASYDCSGRGQGKCVFSDMLPVGSKSPQGNGKWGQADLAGNVWEYTLDYDAEPYRLKSCTDCADLQPAMYRTFRGGGFANEGFYAVTSDRLARSPEIADYDVGLRCARAP